jgi:glycosyltransferase involved in cell wall biosynthesis
MRIGITCYPTYGGSGVVATELGIELAASGHEVHFISYSQPFRLSGRDDGIFYHEVPVSSYPLFEFPPYDLALASRMAEVAEFCNLDLLHVHYAIPHSVSALLARQMLAARGRKLPFVTTLHGTDITLVGLDRSYLPITRYAIQESDGVTSISSYLKEKTVADFAVSRPIEVIPNFVNCDVYTPFVDDSVRSHARSKFAKPDEAVFIHLKINDRIHFLGKQDRVNELLPLADLMIMPSALESFGLAALEAMACKVPAIATSVGGVPELIEDGVTGLLYPVGDIDGMASGAVSLLKDRSRLDSMREAARKDAQKRFCATLVLPKYVKYYEQILGI